MKTKQDSSFWPSYTDLMTSLFFVMLLLYVITYVKLKSTIELQAKKLAIITAVEENLKPLKAQSGLFQYEDAYKRFKLAFDVKFKSGLASLNTSDLENFSTTITKIDEAGRSLKNVIDGLYNKKATQANLKDVSYIVVIAGYASKNSGGEKYNYDLSYQRALSLKNYWKTIGIDFEDIKYTELIDLQIAGNGWGGIGRTTNDEDNQRFLIQIFPKIGEIK
jgi:outer membrane protein OmpA-like peptidoglycan-associated protein